MSSIPTASIHTLLADVIKLCESIVQSMLESQDPEVIVERIAERNEMVIRLFSQADKDQTKRFLDILMPIQAREEECLLVYKQELELIANSLGALQKLKAYS